MNKRMSGLMLAGLMLLLMGASCSFEKPGTSDSGAAVQPSGEITKEAAEAEAKPAAPEAAPEAAAEAPAGE